MTDMPIARQAAFAIRSARAADAGPIARLVQQAANEGLLLPRDEDDVLEHLQEFFVAEEDGRLLGAGALHIYTQTLAEIRSLVVDQRARGRGVGRALVQALEAHARTLGIRQIFALTYEVGFFQRLGYREVAKESLPHKIWHVCVHCAHFPQCNETAMRKELA